MYYTDANIAFLGNDPNRHVRYTNHATLARNSSSLSLLTICLLHVFLSPKSECGVPNLFTYLQNAFHKKIRSQKIFNYIDNNTSCKTAVCMCIIQKFSVTEDGSQQPCKLSSKQYGKSLVTGPGIQHKKPHDGGGT